jgi:hypothetical protein
MGNQPRLRGDAEFRHGAQPRRPERRWGSDRPQVRHQGSIGRPGSVGRPMDRQSSLPGERLSRSAQG